MNAEKYDVIVMGGGPAGSTTASFVAKAGYSVLLLEKEKFPRYQIGESLLPSTILGICKMLGVQDELSKANFIPKRGGTFLWGKTKDLWSFNFEQNTYPGAIPRANAYQVRRSDFDNILLSNARKLGVKVIEGCPVNSVIIEEDRIVGVNFGKGPNNNENRRAFAKFVVDATGHRTTFYKSVGERIYSKYFQNFAMFSYFKNAKRLDPPSEGNILSAAFSDGWIWYIPLTDQLTSVGVVLDKRKLKDITDLESEYNRHLSRCPVIRDFLENATRSEEEPYNQLRVRKDYSYNSTRYWHNGMVLVGDSACFVDPLFSSGVHLATYSGLLAARSINSVLSGDLLEEECFKEFETRYRNEYANFYNFLISFYDMEQEKEGYFWEARRILNTEEAGNTAFIKLISGLSTEGIPESVGAGDYFKVRERVGELIGDKIAGKKSQADEESNKEQHPLISHDQFMKGFTKEIVSLQVQAQLHELGIKPQVQNNEKHSLEPSDDLLRWVKV